MEIFASNADECRITTTTFDAAGNTVLLTAVDPNHDGLTDDNQVTVYNYYDPYSPALVTRIKYPDSLDAAWDSVTFTYALDGALTTRTSQRKTVGDAATVIAFDYDETFRRMKKQRVTQVGTGVDDAVRAIGYAYDTLGRREFVTSYDDPDEGNVLNEIQYTFNDLWMLEREYQEHDGIVDGSLYVEYAYETSVDGGVYDKGMRPISVKYPNARTVHTLYVDPENGSGIGDKISRVTALSNEDTRADEDEVYAAYAYNGAGRIVLETQKHGGSTVAELDYYQGSPGTYDGFDRFGRVVDQKWTDGTDPIDRYGYGYDRNSNRLYRENVLAATRSEVYAYDGLDRLVGMDRGTLNEPKTAITGTPTRQEDWNLNQTGNWAGYDVAENGSDVLVQTRDNNKANEIIGIDETTGPEWLTPQWDARGNMLSGPVPGAETTRQHYKWDAWNRMVAVYADDEGEAGDLIATYRYDGSRRRIAKLLGPDPENPDSTYDFYYNRAWQILEVRKDGIATENLHEQYVWSRRYIDSPVLRDRDIDDDGELDERLYYTTDANMNVTALVEPDGDVAERYTYDPYGKVTIRNPSTWAEISWANSKQNHILYCGYYFDDESGLYSVRYRYYHPTLGRWLSRDPLIPQPMGNLYSYVGERPTDQRDPFGLSALTDFALAATVAETYIERAGRGPFQRVRNWMGNVEDDLRVKFVSAVASVLLRENSQLSALLDSKMREFAATLCEVGPGSDNSTTSKPFPEEPFKFNSQPLSGTLGTGRLSGTMTGSVSEVSNCECGFFKIDATWQYKDVIQFMDWASAYEGGWFDDPITAPLVALEGWLHLNNDTINGASYPLLATWNESISDCCELLEGNP